jgi:hypothetical protein
VKTRKELKEEYKQMKFRMGVFRIRNTVSEKIFVGSSADLVAIWHAQKLQLDFGIHPNAGLQKDWIHYGRDNFVYEVIEEMKPDDDPETDVNKEIRALEELILEKLQP